MIAPEEVALSFLVRSELVSQVKACSRDTYPWPAAHPMLDIALQQTNYMRPFCMTSLLVPCGCDLAWRLVRQTLAA